MPALFVSSLIIIVIEISLFGLLWLQNPFANLLVVTGHFATTLLAAFWFASHWSSPTLNTQQLRWFVACLVGLLPVIGSLLLMLIDNHKALRQYGIQEGLGADEDRRESVQDSLNYFSAPAVYEKGNVRNTRGLISSIDDEAYLGMLIASRHLPDKQAYSLLSEALFSPFESARLMAYSLRGKLENRIAEALEDKQHSLKAATHPKQRIELHLSLAQDYLHVINVGIESRDKNSLALLAKAHCIKALRLDKQSITGLKTLSKVLKLQGHLIQAKKAEQRAFSLAST